MNTFLNTVCRNSHTCNYSSARFLKYLEFMSTTYTYIWYTNYTNHSTMTYLTLHRTRSRPQPWLLQFKHSSYLTIFEWYMLLLHIPAIGPITNHPSPLYDYAPPLYAYTSCNDNSNVSQNSIVIVSKNNHQWQ